jgi:hypothetical protein
VIGTAPVPVDFGVLTFGSLLGVVGVLCVGVDCVGVDAAGGVVAGGVAAACCWAAAAALSHIHN